MVAITLTELEHASFDANSLAQFANGDSATTIVSRLGGTYPTLRKLIKDIYSQIGYQVPVAYTTGISLTVPSQTVSYNNVIYAPNLNDLPFTTSGTFETAKFRVIQGITSDDLVSINAHIKAGYAIGGKIIGAVTESIVNAELAKLGVETVRIHNSSNKHIVLTDGNVEAIIKMDSDGSVQIVAYAGTADQNTFKVPKLSDIPIVTGNKGFNQALTSTVRALEDLGLIRNYTT